MPDARAATDKYIQEMYDEAGGDPERLLALAGQARAASRAFLVEVERILDETAMDLRDRGVPMTRLARLARVSDSYLTRRLLRRGAKRKFDRRCPSHHG